MYTKVIFFSLYTQLTKCLVLIISLGFLLHDINTVLILQKCKPCCFLITFILDHPVHPPPPKGNPWEIEFQPSANYIIKFEKGVGIVYANEQAVVDGTPNDYRK